MSNYTDFGRFMTRLDLKPIPFNPIPAPDAYELGDDGWVAWDSAMASLDRLSPEGRAQTLFEL